MTRALYRVRSVTARRQLRWIVWGTGLGALPFVFGYALPFALGFTPAPRFELTAVLLGLVPLAFASAIIRYRLMDVEVIIKRGLVYAAAIAAIAAIYTIAPQNRRQLVRDRAERHEPGHRVSGDDGAGAAGAAGEERHPDRRSTASTTAIATTIAARSSASRATSTAISICSA